MRGDASDNVFSAYRRIRKNKLLEAFEDRTNQGFAWNNMMLQRWVDHNNVEHRVKDDYERNKRLIDLMEQPDDIREQMNETINSITVKKNTSVGIHFMKFCGKHNLQKLGDDAQRFSEILNSSYLEV